ncbi:haloalkane dehalogenase [Pendulispora albinea]|uniref:Haloalkane dehalogenase n=1 Tax=Pendulispora albinea TaxID=2741071 RepID=A0ABZ2M2M6_9BACT
MNLQHPKKRIHVLGHSLAYVDRGQGDPIVFLHGNPTSSYLWRNVIDPLAARGRCIAPDLIGMGDSDKLDETGPDAYSFFRHRAFLDAFLEALFSGEAMGAAPPDGKITLVVHDWGSALGFDWARRHPDKVRGIAYMEAIVGPLSYEGWDDRSRAVFQALRSPAGEKMILEDNVFIERILPGSILRKLSEVEHDAYRRPFLEPGESRRPTLSFPRLLPIDGEPAAMCEVAQQYADWLAASPIPKLFVNAEPGRVLVGKLREACRRWPNQREVTVRGLHFLQEDSPLAIAEAISDWLDTLPPSA